MYDVLTVHIGHPRYQEIIGILRTDQAALGLLWTEAETRFEESEAKQWTVTMGQHPDGSWSPAAWCAHEIKDGLIACTDHYHHPWARDPSAISEANIVFPAAVLHRQRAIERLSPRLPAQAFVFPGAERALVMAGWTASNDTGPGELAGNTWRRWTWTPANGQPAPARVQTAGRQAQQPAGSATSLW